MSNFYKAIESGTDLAIIRNNKVIGKAKLSVVKGDEFAGVYLADEAAQSLVPKERLCGLEYRHAFLHYSPITGAFLGFFENDPEFDDLNDELMDTLVVDQFNLRWGMVPDHFNQCEGYKDALKNEDADNDAS